MGDSYQTARQLDPPSRKASEGQGNWTTRQLFKYMTYKEAKGFFIFWIVAAIVWLFAGIRTYYVSNGTEVNWYYFFAAATSSLIAIYYLKGVSKYEL